MPPNRNPSYVSPTDNLMTPVTQKISAAKKKHFNKSVITPALPIELVDNSFLLFRGQSKPMPSLFSENIADTSDNEEEDTIPPTSLGIPGESVTTEDNPF